MILRLRVRNFQNHADRTFILSPGANFIVGDSDRGKTAIFRALYWLVMARPLGEEFVRHGQDRCTVSLVMDNGTVKRRRSRAGVSKYLLIVGGEDKLYQAAGTKVPDDVAEFLNLNELNFQHQLDQPFWFLDTAGQVSQNLNAVVNLGKIDDVLFAASSKSRAAAGVVSATHERVSRLEEEIAGLSWVAEYEDDLGVVERSEGDWAHAKETREELEGLVSILSNQKVRRSRYEKAAADGSVVVALAGKALSTHDSRSELETLISRATELQAQTELDLPGSPETLTEDMDRMSTRHLSLADLRKNAHHLSSLISNLEVYQAQIEAYELELADLQETLAEESEGLCPLCGNPTSSPSHVPTCT